GVVGVGGGVNVTLPWTVEETSYPAQGWSCPELLGAIVTLAPDPGVAPTALPVTQPCAVAWLSGSVRPPVVTVTVVSSQETGTSQGVAIPFQPGTRGRETGALRLTGLPWTLTVVGADSSSQKARPGTTPLKPDSPTPTFSPPT